MEKPGAGRLWAACRSIVTKNIALFLIILLAAVVPLAVRYYQDSREYEIKVLASRLEFFAERGAGWVDPAWVEALRGPADMNSPPFHKVVAALNRIEREFGVDNAVVMRRRPDGHYEYVALGDNAYRAVGGRPGAPVNPCTGGGNPCAAGANPCSAPANPCSTDESPARRAARRFDLGMPVDIHRWFPATYRATEATWQAGEMMHSQLFGGKVGRQYYDPFLQVNTPLKRGGRVVAILMLNKFAKPVADRVKTGALRLVGLSAVVVAVGLALFGLASARMLRPLRWLTDASGEVTRGNLDVKLPAECGCDEVGRLTGAFTSMVEGLRQRDFIRDAFGRYISEEVVDELLSRPGGLELGGELREVTFLVSDLRGFTAMSAQMAPNEIVRFVNRYLERMVEIIARHQGTVDEFQGDGILAFFGAPVARPDDPERAVACAVAMQRALVELNEEQRRRGLPELDMGVGVSTGEVIVGNIGSERRAKYGALGTPINTAYRIESATVSGQVLIGPETYARVRGVARVAGSQDLAFKGLAEPVRVHEVTGVGGRWNVDLPERAPEDFAALDPPLEVAAYPLDGKQVSEEPLAGRVVRLSDHSAEAAWDRPPAPGTNLKLRFAGGEGLRDVYAKVVEGTPAGAAWLRFTSLPEDARAFLDAARKRAT